MKRLTPLAAGLILLLGVGGVARAELSQDGNVLVSFDGGISPQTLPRSGTAPVTVNIETTIKTVDGADPPPQLREIAIGINREGKIFDRGLPTCKVRRIQPATIAAARRICGGAIVGSGSVSVRVNLENQQPFTFNGPMLVFNASPTGGKRRLLAQVYGVRPPSAFVLTFKILKTEGKYGTLIRTRLPASARKWAYVTHFDMKLRRTYVYRGKSHSFVNAGCAAPAGFPTAPYAFARGKFSFAGGNQVTSTLIRTCRAAD